MEKERFQEIIADAIQRCRGGWCDTFCKITGEQICPITIILTTIQVPIEWIQFFGNIKATHTPMKQKLEEFFDEDQLDILIKIEDIYYKTKEVTVKQKEKMFRIAGQSWGACAL